MAYNIGVIGTGYVGLVSGTCFAATGNYVYCVDIDENKVEKLKQGVCPIYEPGLSNMLESNIRDERLYFTTDLKQAVDNCNIIFLCLPTPPSEDGSADLQHVKKVAADIAEILKTTDPKAEKIVVNKSTVPVGTSKIVQDIFDNAIAGNNVSVVSNPEFLREGFAVEDAMKPDRIVVGTSNLKAAEVMRDLYKPFVRSGNPIYIMDEKSAEVTKYAANAFLATKISFMNDLSAYCEKVGADIDSIRLGIGSDTRIGKRFLFAGVGYGGSCFPKDVRAIMYSAESAGTPLSIVEAAHRVNENQIARFAELVIEKFGTDLRGKKFAIWGLAFKPNTDDTREAPAFRIIERLLEAGAEIHAYDPEAMDNTKLIFGDRISYHKNMYDCVDNAEALIIVTEWTVFRNPDFEKIKSSLKNNIIFDGRNLFTIEEMEAEGFSYYSIGRKYVD
ncbi:MAG: UDP-glucose/GDP-mannose dehydrogenase family protein [Candidatus Kapabacteria bacterium]|nr:UDP-glucose/GDP-mannose dehydrogenase family protein [Ignavibacteriota bacterium]MCW5883616.1 UDP-glucose/GDP-mannose dehydrogenase family protein [Candidatus Kapabacteria bacterium]